MSPRLLRPRQVGGFTPRSLTGITSWFDAQDTSTITLNSGNVSEWRSKAGGWTASQSTAANQPGYVSNFLTSRRAVRFTAGTHALDLTATWNDLGNNTALTITEFYVLQWPTGSNQAFIQEASAPSGHKIFAYFANSQAYYDAGPEATARVFGNVGSGITTGVVITAFRNGGTVTLSYNETQVATRSNATGNIYNGITNLLRIVGPSSGSSSLAEMITYSRALSSAEQARVRSYLYARYGL
jgi:hypothetical protein